MFRLRKVRTESDRSDGGVARGPRDGTSAPAAAAAVVTDELDRALPEDAGLGPEIRRLRALFGGAGAIDRGALRELVGHFEETVPLLETDQLRLVPQDPRAVGEDVGLPFEVRRRAIVADGAGL